MGRTPKYYPSVAFLPSVVSTTFSQEIFYYKGEWEIRQVCPIRGNLLIETTSNPFYSKIGAALVGEFRGRWGR